MYFFQFVFPVFRIVVRAYHLMRKNRGERLRRMYERRDSLRIDFGFKFYLRNRIGSEETNRKYDFEIMTSIKRLCNGFINLLKWFHGF